MQTTRRSFLWIVLGAATAACSSTSASNAPGDDGGASDAASADAAASDSSSGDASTARTFVGDVQGIDGRVALVVEGQLAFLFFCGGPSTFATATKWFRGDVALDAPFSLTDTGWTAAGSLQSNGSITGTLDRGDGTPLAWTAAPIVAGTSAGLYEATDTDGVAALIVEQAQATDMPSLQGAFKTPTSVISQVVPLQPLPDGFKVQVTVNGAMKELTMLRAHPH